ncbi:P2X purinoceptor 4-like [Corticium candelabrum]|uniref:P2X purinoceptor 4-like n=1 Tax=Corticium candelabrum TaxID=121492 RepID=UPI002E257B6A|nr:P2X purinoceptor 4-like [Corticium candelabrum]
MGNRCLGCIQATSSAIFDYNTVKLMHIRNQKIGFVYRLVQLSIIGYILGYVIIFKKGYQQTDSVVSSVTTKMKGTAMTKGPNGTLWDVADYVVPPEEHNAVFVTTNAIITPNQVQSVCHEDPHLAPCVSDDNCTAGEYVKYGHGMQTGLCDTDAKACLIHSWCPLEIDETPHEPLLGNATKNFTLLIKNTIQYQKFDFTKRNLLQRTIEYGNHSYLHTCTYHKDNVNDRYCPIFVLSQIVEYAGADWHDLAVNGGVLGIFIKWDCDLDQGFTACVPKYSFSRMDKINSSIAKGYNFRYPVYFKENGDNRMHRQLIKAYGIRFQIIVSGQAGRFSIVPLALNIGSGIALLAIATVICDLLVNYVVKKRKYYRENKYQLVEDEETLLPVEDDDQHKVPMLRSERDSLNRSTEDTKKYTK